MSQLGVSLVCGCGNRSEFLIKVISSWLSHAEINEIIIVDWNSTKPVASELTHIDDSRVKVFRVINVDRWILSIALNFGVKQATFPLLLKVDSDTILKKDFFEKHPLNTNNATFYTGNWKLAKNENENHLNGVLFLPTTYFTEVGGYNEHIQTYGWDDSDIYERLANHGLERKDFFLDSLHHIEHSNEIRGKDLKLEICKNMHLAKRMPWNTNLKGTRFVELEPNLYQPSNWQEHTPPHQVVEECTTLAYRTILNDQFGYTWNMTNKSREALIKLYHRRTWPKFVIEPKNGLGNRLRALASAACIAGATNRNLVVVWTQDVHFEAAFDDIFQDDDIIHVKTKNNLMKPFAEMLSSDNIHSFANFLDMTTTQRRDLDKNDIFVVSAVVLPSRHTSWQKESEWLQNKLKLKPSLQQSINSYSARFSVNDMADVIGVHIRMGQDAGVHQYEDCSTWLPVQIEALKKHRAQSNSLYFMIEMEKIWRKDPSQKFFICADNADIYESFIKKYPGKPICFVTKVVWDRSLDQLNTAVIDVYLLSKCKYVLGSPWSSFSELVPRLAKPGRGKILVAGQDFGCFRYGLLFYPNSYNLGDDVQSLAARQFLPTVDYLVDRDNQQDQVYDLTGKPCGKLEQLNNQLVVVENGWFDSRFSKFPLSTKIKPLFISFHLNESVGLFSDPRYAVHKEQAAAKAKLLENVDTIDYFKQHQPIGCRDQHTSDLLSSFGIETYCSSCLTLTLDPLKLGLVESLRQEILVVDANIDEPVLFKQLVPERVKKLCKYFTHGLKQATAFEKKQELIMELLQRYRNAKCVVTSRIHVALPCLAFNTPVLFIYSKMDQDPRFDYTMKRLLGNGTTLTHVWNWDKPEIPDETRILVKQLASRLYQFFDTLNNF